LAEMALLWHQVALMQTVPGAIAADEPEREALAQLAERIAPEDVQLYYQIALHGRRDLALAPDEMAGFSMTLLRMLAFHPGDKPAATAPPASGAIQPAAAAAKAEARPAAVSSQGAAAAKGLLAQLSGRAPRVESPAAPEPEPATVPEAAQAPVSARAPAEPAAKPEPIVAPARIDASSAMAPDDNAPPWDDESNDLAIGTMVAEEDFVPAPPEQEDAPPAVFDGDWIALIGELGPRMGAARMLAQNAMLKSFDGHHLALAVPEDFRHLAARDYQEKLKSVLAERFGTTLVVSVGVENLGLDTPAMKDARDRQAQLAEARESLETDPVVRQFVRDFDARLLTDTIQPIQES